MVDCLVTTLTYSSHRGDDDNKHFENFSRMYKDTTAGDMNVVGSCTYFCIEQRKFVVSHPIPTTFHLKIIVNVVDGICSGFNLLFKVK